MRNMTMTCRAATSALWMVLLIDSIPGVALLGRDNAARMLLLSVAITASLAQCMKHMQRPLDDVFNEGREHERRVMLREMNECKVLPFDRTGA